MNITLYKDGNKSVKTLSFNDLIETMKDPVAGRTVKEFREKFPTVGTVMIGRGLIRNPALAEMILQEETEACTIRGLPSLFLRKDR